MVNCDEQSVEQYVIGTDNKYRLSQKVTQSSIGSSTIIGFQILVAAIFLPEALTDRLT